MARQKQHFLGEMNRYGASNVGILEYVMEAMWPLFYPLVQIWELFFLKRYTPGVHFTHN